MDLTIEIRRDNDYVYGNEYWNTNTKQVQVIRMQMKNPHKQMPAISRSEWIFKTAVIVGSVVIGDDVFVAPNAVTRADEPGSSIVIGSNTPDASLRNATPCQTLLKLTISIRWTLWDRDTSKATGGPASLNLIDVVSSKAHIRQYAGQTMDNVIEFLLDCWTKNAVPNYLRMDNDASFIGDLIHSRHFSRVVRFCLHLGVEPVFITPSKPWMNGKIEDFNGISGISCGNKNNGQIRNTFGEGRKSS